MLQDCFGLWVSLNFPSNIVVYFSRTNVARLMIYLPCWCSLVCFYPWSMSLFLHVMISLQAPLQAFSCLHMSKPILKYFQLALLIPPLFPSLITTMLWLYRFWSIGMTNNCGLYFCCVLVKDLDLNFHSLQ
jgi:hypothetical protein